MNFPDPLFPQYKAGVLLINTGSPDTPDAASVRRYLAEFLSDERVIELPKWKWWPILHGIILTVRPAKSAQRYKGVWTKDGSPLIVHTRKTAEKLQAALGADVKVEWAMRYGNPNVKKVFKSLAASCEKVLVMPMFAQYAAQTSAACVDEVLSTMLKMRSQPSLRTVRDYHLEPAYIDALAAQVKASWEQFGRHDEVGGMLVMSFHGIPKKSSELGDVYERQCKETAAALAERLELREGSWMVAFQSRFGREEWLPPYTLPTVQRLGKTCSRVDVICPGFAADCLETLEEIGDELRCAYQLENPDGAFHYIPALNDSDKAVAAYETIIRRELGGWI